MTVTCRLYRSSNRFPGNISVISFVEKRVVSGLSTQSSHSVKTAQRKFEAENKHIKEQDRPGSVVHVTDNSPYCIDLVR